MTDRWYYRMFGEQFGPVPIEKLKELADCGTIQAFDQIRAEDSSDWVAAATIDELGLSTSTRSTATLVEPTIEDFDFSAPQAASIDDFDFSTPQPSKVDDFDSSPQSSSEEWFCRLGENELGPLSFEELLKFAEYEQLCADDQVSLGNSGLWRRAGSIGRLMAALPYKSVARTIVAGAAKSKSECLAVESSPSLDDFQFATSTVPSPALVMAATPVSAAAPGPDATFRVAYEQARAKLTESMLAQADAAFQVAEDQAKSQVVWATTPNVDRFWWGWAGGVEFGPVEFTQIFGLAKSGQLKPCDFVRNGSHGQFVPSSGVSGLFNAVQMIARATEARDLAKAQAQAAASLALPPPVVPTELINATEKAAATVQFAQQARSNPSISTPVAIPRSNPPMETICQPPIPSKPTARRPPAPRSTWFSDSLEGLKQPKAIGSACAIALVLLVFGWNFLPKSRAADIKRYQALKQLLDDVRSKRTTAPAELTAIQQKLEKVSKEISLELKSKASREEPAKQCLLWAARDEVPRFIQAGLAMESQAEKNLTARLQDAAYELGLERRPAVSPPRLATPDDDS